MTSRNARFVAAARRLLLMQVGACLLAVAVASWAWFEVRGLVRERDALAAQIGELERRAQALPMQAPAAEIGPMPAPAPRRTAPPRTNESPEPAGKSVETPPPAEPSTGEATATDPKPTDPARDPPRETNRLEEAPLTRR
jgi:hypothetical protein